MEEAIAILNAIPEPAEADEQDYKALILCFTQTELAVHNGTLSWDEVEAATAWCGIQAPMHFMVTLPADEATSAINTVGIRPNPAKDLIWIIGLGDGECTVRIRDTLGRTVLVAETSRKTARSVWAAWHRGCTPANLYRRQVGHMLSGWWWSEGPGSAF